MIHPGIEGVFCVISIDLNTLRGFQDSVEGGEGGVSFNNKLPLISGQK